MKKMKKLLQLSWLLIAFAIITASCTEQNSSEDGLKDALEGKFYMGAALNGKIIMGKDTASMNILQQHFNSVTAENVMKSGPIQPVEGEFVFEVPDRLIELGVQNNLYVVGHCLVWHSQAPRWFFVDEEGNDVVREVLIERMKTHIFTVVGRYKGKVDAWDVVNEAFEDDGTWRQSPFYRIIGDDFIHLAFKFAHEADPAAEFMYNDYNLYIPSKRDAVIKLVMSLKEAGLQIDGVGMQGHYGLNSPSNEDLVNSIVAFSETGVQVHITELDISVLPSPYENAGANISNKAEYTEFMKIRAIPDYIKTKGFIKLTSLKRTDAEFAYFNLITFWTDLDVIKNFAGVDLEKAKYYEEDKNYLIDFPEKVTHYEVFAE